MRESNANSRLESDPQFTLSICPWCAGRSRDSWFLVSFPAHETGDGHLGRSTLDIPPNLGYYVNVSLSPLQSLTPDQRDQLLALIDECRALGASPFSLGPLYGALGVFDPDFDVSRDHFPTQPDDVPTHPIYD